MIDTLLEITQGKPDVLERESLNINDNCKTCYLCLDLSCDHLQQHKHRGKEVLHRDGVWVPLAWVMHLY